MYVEIKFNKMQTDYAARRLSPFHLHYSQKDGATTSSGYYSTIATPKAAETSS